jgi:ferric-dicitrate binding protein FerR (iron transport regulator)
VDDQARVEDLTLRLLDGVLTANEADELERILDKEPGTSRSHQGLLDLEACLRGGREAFDVMQRTMTRLGEVLEDEITRGSMNRIRSQASPAWKTRHSSPKRDRVARSRPGVLIAAVALLMVLVAGALIMVLDPFTPRPTIGIIEKSTPGVVLTRDGPRETTEAMSGAPLAPGDSVRVPLGGSARIRCGDALALELGPSTSLTLAEPSNKAGPHGRDRARLIVNEGTVVSKASPGPVGGPLVFATPHAEASTASGELVISVRPESTVFEVREGHVQIRRTSDGAVLELTPGSFALASPSAPLVAKPISEGRKHHSDTVPPDHTTPPSPFHGHDQDFPPEPEQR